MCGEHTPFWVLQELAHERFKENDDDDDETQGATWVAP